MNKTIIIDNLYKKKKPSQYYRQKTYDCKKIIIDKKNFCNFDEEKNEIDLKIKKYPSIIKKNLFLNNDSSYKNPFITRNQIQLKKIKTFNIPVFKQFKRCSSITTNTSEGEKMKKVTFSTVEIIRVEKYKKYNARCNFSKHQIEKNMEEMKLNKNEFNCNIF